MTTIGLRWEGPFSLDTNENRTRFRPPNNAGVYIWAVGKENDLRISYVGQSSNLRNRMYEHIFSTLGGAYWLYEDAHFLSGDKPSEVYRSGLENILGTYIPNFRELSVTAYRNLILNKIFWAILEANSKTRKLVESALIRDATENEEPIQNERVSVKPTESVSLLINAPFPNGCRLHGNGKSIQY